MFIELERKRRSIRKYKSRPIEAEKIDTLVNAALLSPSSRANYPWEFIVVDDKPLIEALASAKSAGSAFLAGAPLAIVVCAETAKSDVWIEDASIASTMILLAAESLDLGACWIQIRKRQHNDETSAEAFIRESLNLPDKIAVLCIIAIGYPDESKPGRSKSELLYKQVHKNVFGASL
jgi:nitroreductase